MAALDQYPNKEAFERGVSFFCHEYEVHEYGFWTNTSNDEYRCEGTVTLAYDASCWEGGNKNTGCNLSIAHTHPWFTKDDFGTPCKPGFTIEDEDDAYSVNNGGMKFSKADIDELLEASINGQLAVSDRSCIKTYRRLGDTFGRVSTIDGACTPTPLPEPEDDDEDDEDDGESQE